MSVLVLGILLVAAILLLRAYRQDEARLQNEHRWDGPPRYSVEQAQKLLLDNLQVSSLGEKANLVMGTAAAFEAAEPTCISRFEYGFLVRVDTISDGTVQRIDLRYCVSKFTGFIRPVNKEAYLLTIISDQSPTADKNAEPHMGPPTSAPAVQAIEGAFDSMKGLKMLYGQELANPNSVIWSNPPVPPSGFSFFDSTRKSTVRVVAALHFQEEAAQRVLLVVSAQPIDPHWACHACTNLVGAAEFELTGSTWHLQAFNPFAASGGAWGTDPHLELLQIGRDRVGLRLLTSDMAQGQETTTTQIVAAEGGWIGRVLLLDTASSGCLGSDGCWSSKVNMQFRPEDSSDYYGLRLTTTGTKLLTDRGLGIVPVNETRSLRFIGHSYR